MKRLVSVSTVLIMIGLAVLIVGQRPAEAGKRYDNGDLNGAYYYVTTEVRLEHLPGDPDPTIEYCSGFGTATFDGMGTASINGTTRCSATGLDMDTSTNIYTVNPDGSFLIWNVDFPDYVTHCQIVNKGRMVLCDGTPKNPERLSFQAIAVKQ